MPFLIAIFLCFALNTHDVQIAIFKFQEIDKQLEIQMVFEKEDLLFTFSEANQKLNDEQMQKYLQKNLTFSINHKKQHLDYGQMKTNEKHIHLTAKTPILIEEIVSVQIENTCLLNIPNHSNIIKIRLFDQERDFLMNDKRAQISVNLTE